MGNKCALCGSRDSHGYIGSKRTKGKLVCLECLKELDTQRDEFIAQMQKFKDKLKILGRAGKKGLEAFREEIIKGDWQN